MLESLSTDFDEKMESNEWRKVKYEEGGDNTYEKTLEYLLTLTVVQIHKYLCVLPCNKYFANHISTFSILQDVATEHRLRDEPLRARFVTR